MGEPLGLTRAAIGFAQGVVLYYLYNAFEAKTWPATEGALFAPLVLVGIFIPTVAVAGCSNLRPRNFAAWIVAATAILAGLAAYDILRDPGGAVEVFQTLPQIAPPPRNVPSITLWLAVPVGLFIAQALIVSGDADRRFIAGYARYFDIAWKHGLQIALVALFLGVFWLLLLLGAALFKLIKIDFLAELITKEWFAVPASTFVVACAIHITDVHAGIVRGVRTLTLTLLSWLMPLMAAMAVAFLAALVFTGLEPLWSTRRATAVLLLAASALVLLLNAAYQDGPGEQPVARIVRYAGTVTAVTLTPLVTIAAYAVALRVGQYGWTPERIIALACVVVAACYALGYLLAAIQGSQWLKWIEPSNVFTAFVVLAVILALLSPVADPARISVADQVARLESGRISPEDFDYQFLRFRSGRYGLAALDRLRMKQDGPDAARIAERANAALGARTLFDAQQARQRIERPTPAERAANIAVVYPKGQSLPASFAQQDWYESPDRWRHPQCLTGHVKCDAMVLDLDGDGKPEILILNTQSGVAMAYKQTGESWSLLGNVANSNCRGVHEALANGNFELVTPELKELRAAGQRLLVQPGCK